MKHNAQDMSASLDLLLHCYTLARFLVLHAISLSIIGSGCSTAQLRLVLCNE